MTIPSQEINIRLALIVFVTKDSILVLMIASFGKLDYKVPLILDGRELAQVVNINRRRR